MAEVLDAYLRENKCKDKCAYVVPTYEIDDRVMFPHNKTELIRLANKGLARPFHHKVFIYNQFATNFSRLVQYFYFKLYPLFIMFWKKITDHILVLVVLNLLYRSAPTTITNQSLTSEFCVLDDLMFPIIY